MGLMRLMDHMGLLCHMGQLSAALLRLVRQRDSTPTAPVSAFSLQSLIKIGRACFN